MRIAFITCTLFVFCAAGVSSATTIQSGPYTTTTPIPFTLTDWAGTLAFPQFDPAIDLTSPSFAYSLNSGDSGGVHRHRRVFARRRNLHGDGLVQHRREHRK